MAERACTSCGRAHASLFCPAKPKQPCGYADRETCTHDREGWEQIGRCVYCRPCGTRLFQGRLNTTTKENNE